MSEAPKVVVPFESDELRQLKDAARHLADMAGIERDYRLPKRAQEIGVEEKVLRRAVHTELGERAKLVTVRLPVARQGKELQRLAERLGEDVATLREEFDESLGVGADAMSVEKTEPWPATVDTNKEKD